MGAVKLGTALVPAAQTAVSAKKRAGRKPGQLTQFHPPVIARRKPGQRVMDHGARSRIAEWRAHQATWQKPIDEISCDPRAFYHLRRNVLGLNRKQTARLLRCTPGSVLNWENGTHPPPFYAYLALRLISESQHYKFANEAWRDWGFTQRFAASGRGAGKHETYFCNSATGDAFTPEDLTSYGEQIKRLAALDAENTDLRTQVAALTEENANVRELFKAGSLADELHEMKDRLQALLVGIGKK